MFYDSTNQKYNTKICIRNKYNLIFLLLCCDEYFILLLEYYDKCIVILFFQIGRYTNVIINILVSDESLMVGYFILVICLPRPRWF